MGSLLLVKVEKHCFKQQLTFIQLCSNYFFLVIIYIII